jgi:hypothetical protein
MSAKSWFAVAIALTVPACDSGAPSIVTEAHRAVMVAPSDDSLQPCDELLQQNSGGVSSEEVIHCIGPMQGRSLLGSQFSALVDASLSTFDPTWSDGDVRSPVDSWVAVDDSGIDARIGGVRLVDSELAGLTFALETPTGQVRAVRVALSAGFEPDSTGRSRYDVEYLTSSAEWRPYCSAGQYAYAIPGHFVAGHFIHLGLTFACQNSAAAKAIRWGYAPYGNSAPLSYSLYEAATRLARADYCGSDSAHTVDGTEVLVYDLGEPKGESVVDAIDQPASGSSLLAPFKFEAAWAVQFPRQSHALCLSKLRWQMLPPDFCGDDLPDPRTRATGQYCEDLGGIDVDDFKGFLVRLKSQGALIFSSSRYNEVGLWNWFGTQNRTITTTTGYWAGPEGGTSTPPRANAQSGAFSISPSQQGFVGVVSVSAHAGMAPLRLYFNNATKAYRTSIRPPTAWCGIIGCASNSWASTGVIVGYVFADVTQARGARTVALRAWSTMEGTDVEQAKYILLPEGVAGKAPFTHLLSGIEGYAFAKDQQ